MQSQYRSPQPIACLKDTVSAVDSPVCQRPQWSNFRRYSHTSEAGNHALILDLDNTLTDTRRWFADFILGATDALASDLMLPTSLVNSHFADVALSTTLHEYAYVVESICSLLNRHKHLTYKQISQAAEQFWSRFSEAHQKIKAYEGVKETLVSLRSQFPTLKIVILTDSPYWVALERLSIVGLLAYVDGVVAIRSEEPRLSREGYRECVRASRARVEKVMKSVDKRNLQLNLSLPANFAKPSSCGIELIARRLSLGDGKLVICGDKDSKEGLAAHNFRLRQEHLSASSQCTIDFVRADYGNHDLDDPRYRLLARQIHSLSGSGNSNSAPVAVSRSIQRFEQLFGAVGSILSRESRTKNAA